MARRPQLKKLCHNLFILGFAGGIMATPASTLLLLGFIALGSLRDGTQIGMRPAILLPHQLTNVLQLNRFLPPWGIA